MVGKIQIRSKRGAQKAARQVRENMDKAIDASREATFEVIRVKGQRIFEISQELVPRDTDRLANSADLVGETTADKLFRLSISYNTPYAIIVHEDTEVNHPATGPNKRNPARRSPQPSGQLGQAKFLTDAANRVEGSIASDAEQHIKAALRQVFGGSG